MERLNQFNIKLCFYNIRSTYITPHEILRKIFGLINKIFGGLTIEFFCIRSINCLVELAKELVHLNKDSWFYYNVVKSNKCFCSLKQNLFWITFLKVSNRYLWIVKNVNIILRIKNFSRN